ncbi:MAG: response regulator [Lentisphaerales bacterium]|nr:response regulator [Lentisphaerales bacterium]
MNRIMVIEDDHSLSGIIKEYLKEAGHDVVINYNAVSAIRVLKSEKFDAILTDVNMYPVDGYELINEVRRFNKNVKIIAMSGSLPESQKAVNRAVGELKDEGADQFLLKPFTREELQNCFVTAGIC